MAEAPSRGGSLDALEPLAGNWSMVPTFEGMPPTDTGAPVSFEWLSGGRFLIERWEVPVPEAPIWKLWRDQPDFSPLDFSQRFTGTLGGDGTTITGAWEISPDAEVWEHDFDLTYNRT